VNADEDEIPDELDLYRLVIADEDGDGGRVRVRAVGSDAEAGTTTFDASYEQEDRAGDVVRQDWRLREYRANPVILDNHMRTRVVGRALKASVPRADTDDPHLVIQVQWDMDSPDPTIRAVGHQHLHGFRAAGSVGFRWGKATKRDKLATDHRWYSEGRTVDTPWGQINRVGSYYERNTLLEFSSASIPMLPTALQRALCDTPEAQLRAHVDRLDSDDLEARIREVARETLHRSLAEELLSVFRAAGPDLRRSIAACTMAAPPPVRTPSPEPPAPTLDDLIVTHLYSEHIP